MKQSESQCPLHSEKLPDSENRSLQPTKSEAVAVGLSADKLPEDLSAPAICPFAQKSAVSTSAKQPPSESPKCIFARCSKFLHDHIPGYSWALRLARQICGVSPFRGDCLPERVPLLALGSGRPTTPFPTPWNYQQPIEILKSFFWGAERSVGAAKHNRYLDVPGFAPVLVTRDPGIIRAITAQTGDKPGEFDRDTLPSTGIARFTGSETLLYSNGSKWRQQRKIAAAPFGKTSLFQPEIFQEFERTFRGTAAQRLELLCERLKSTGETSMRIALEPEMKTVMLEMLTNNFFGAKLPYEELRNRYVPALERVIDHIVRDTVMNRLGIPIHLIPSFIPGIAQIKEDLATFDALTDAVLSTRREGKGLWSQFKSDAPDEKLRANLKVFLAGALEATTSFASWAISHLARNPDAQARVYQEVAQIDEYSPEKLAQATYLNHVLEETLRLTPSLYFLPRRATADVWVETTDGRKLFIPKNTHILLDVWHANRHEDHWGRAVTGYPATEFAPERWGEMLAKGKTPKDMMHFGFGFGPRVCPGKHLGQLEAALVVGALVKMFEFDAAAPENPVKAGVSTKPLDGTDVIIRIRETFKGAGQSTHDNQETV